MAMTTFHTVTVNNQQIFYREAGHKDAPVVLLLHGFPSSSHMLRDLIPPLLAVWGKNDPFFLPSGADAFERDIPNAEVRFYDTGHFALETHHAEIAVAIHDFLARTVTSVQSIAV